MAKTRLLYCDFRGSLNAFMVSVEEWLNQGPQKRLLTVARIGEEEWLAVASAEINICPTCGKELG